MKVYLGSKAERSSTTTYICFGCHEQLEVEPNWDEGYTYEDVRKLALDLGWYRRTFGPGADPWFCNKECVFESWPAKRAAKLWEAKIEGIELKNDEF